MLTLVDFVMCHVFLLTLVYDFADRMSSLDPFLVYRECSRRIMKNLLDQCKSKTATCSCPTIGAGFQYHSSLLLPDQSDRGVPQAFWNPYLKRDDGENDAQVRLFDLAV